jgi:hypothetical protein
VSFSVLIARYSKGIAAIIGVVTEAINLGLIPHSAQNDVTIIVMLLTAAGVIGVPNGPTAEVAALKDVVVEHKTVLNGHADMLEAQGKEIDALAAQVTPTPAVAPTPEPTPAPEPVAVVPEPVVPPAPVDPIAALEALAAS